MSIFSLGFLIFLVISLTIYYIIPSNYKWLCLLLTSLVFVASYDYKGVIYLVAITLCIWAGAIKINAINDNDSLDKIKKKHNKRAILTILIIISIGALFILKYAFPMAKQIGAIDKSLKIFIPLGLSYFTLQAVSYIMDVYWGKIKAEKSFFKVLLFISYFPQLIQGPINRYKDLSHQLYEKDHKFNINNIKHGVQLAIWGCFKCLVVSDRAAKYTNEIFHTDETPFGFAAFVGLVLYGIQLYGNFSGGIDIIRGVSQCFGIDIPDNFRQPYLSKSLSEFWRRWHITLGTWMKDYVFYPFSMSKPISKFKKYAKKHMSRKWANRIPIAFANIVVFTIVGIWHGFGTNYLLWGFYNGLIIALSELMTDVYKTANTKLKINSESKLWNLFAIARTFTIVTIGRCTDCADTASGSLGIIKNMFSPHSSALPFLSYGKVSLIIFIASLALLIIVEILQDKGKNIFGIIEKQNIFVQIMIWVILIQFIALFGRVSLSGDLMYADF